MLSTLLGELLQRPAAFRDFRKGKRAIETGEYAQALDCFERCIARYPGNADYVFHAAAVRNMMGDPAAAQRQCERALTLDPNHPASHYLLAGLTLRGRGRPLCLHRCGRGPVPPGAPRRRGRW